MQKYIMFLLFLKQVAVFLKVNLHTKTITTKNITFLGDPRRVTNPAHTISAGLMFASQATLHLSALLDVVLPSFAHPR